MVVGELGATVAKTKTSRNRKRTATKKPDIPRHKVFVSFHDCDSDRRYKERFTKLLKGSIIDKSVHDDDIDDDPLKTETVRQKIRDEFIAEATVTVVLIGECTWQRKHVDWEIGSSLRDTKRNKRCGLLGILLPCHQSHGAKSINPRRLPPKLAQNLTGNNAFAKLYNWPDGPSSKKFRRWIHAAFERRGQDPAPKIGKDQFKKNRGGICNQGWKDNIDVPKRVKLL